MAEWQNEEGEAVLTPSAKLREGCGGWGSGCGGSGSGSSKSAPAKKKAAPAKKGKEEEEKEDASVSSATFNKWESYLLKKVMSEIEDWMVDFSEKSGSLDLSEAEIEEILIKTRRKLKQTL